MHKTESKPFSLQSIDIELPHINRQKWSNGSSLITMPPVNQEIYFVTWEFDFDKVQMLTLPNGAVLHKIIKEIIGKKTKHYDSQEIKSFFEEKGARFKVSTTSQSLVLRLSCLAEYWEPCLEKVVEIINDPVLDAKGWKRVQKKLLNRIADLNFDTEWEAGQQLKEQLLGDNDFWNARMTSNTVLSVKSEDLVKAYAYIMNSKGLRIYLGGRWKSADQRSIKKYFSKTNDFKLTIESNVKDLAREFKIKPTKYNGAQFSLRWGRMLMAPKDPSYPIALVAAKALGGYFGSRLMQTLREERGLTYGAYAFVAPYATFTVFEIITDVSKENLALVEQLISDELERLGDELIEDQEWNTIKNNLIGDLLLSLDGPIALINRYRALDARGLTPIDFTTQVKMIQEMKPETVRDFFKKNLKPSIFKKVRVG